MSAVSLDQLAGISRDKSDPYYYRANQIMAVSFLNKMSESCSKRSLEHIAANPLTPVHMLKELALHPLEDVRVAVAENASTPLDTLLTLVNDEQADVRYCLAENTNLPEQILSALCDDENPYVAARAMRSFEIKKMLKRSNRFSGTKTRLKAIGGGEISTQSSIKRFLRTLTNIKALSAILPAKVS